MTDLNDWPSDAEVDAFVASLSGWARELYGPDRADYAIAMRHARTPRACCGRLRSDPLVARHCAFDNCVEFYCACGASDNSSFGPVGCLCQEDGRDDDVHDATRCAPSRCVCSCGYCRAAPEGHRE